MPHGHFLAACFLGADDAHHRDYGMMGLPMFKPRERGVIGLPMTKPYLMGRTRIALPAGDTRHQISTAFPAGPHPHLRDAIRTRPHLRVATALESGDKDAPAPESGDKDDQAGVAHNKGIICGVSAGQGAISCGIPVNTDHQTGAPFIIPLYTPPPPAGIASVASDPQAQRIKARSDMLLKLQAFDFMNKLLTEPAAQSGVPNSVASLPSPVRDLSATSLQPDDIAPDLGPANDVRYPVIGKYPMAGNFM